jgi:predicted enzyme related to lactoylglutathione lyase
MSNPVGSFIWYELMTTDADSAARFHGNVIGWKIGARQDEKSADSGGAASGKDYRMIGRSDGGFAGGALNLTAEMLEHGAHPTWLGYLYVDDVDSAVREIVADDGKLLMPAMTLPVGKIAMVTDPLGVPFYVMKPVPPPGKPDARSDVFDVFASQRVRWNELASRDLGRAQQFYGKHFGFRFEQTMPMGEMGDYCFITHGDIPMIGAIMQRPAQARATGWLFYFGVDSVSAARKAIESGGGKVHHGPHEVPGGQWILISTDPQGAWFGVVGPKGE